MCGVEENRRWKESCKRWVPRRGADSDYASDTCEFEWFETIALLLQWIWYDCLQFLLWYVITMNSTSAGAVYPKVSNDGVWKGEQNKVTILERYVVHVSIRSTWLVAWTKVRHWRLLMITPVAISIIHPHYSTQYHASTLFVSIWMKKKY